MHPTLTALNETPSPSGPTIDSNPYKAKRTWPPNFDKLSRKDQFRLERRYKRRTQLKWARPRWMAATKLAQWGLSTTILFYGIFFMQWGNDDNAFAELRSWLKRSKDAVFTQPSPPRPEPRRESNEPS